ncbi:DUF3299 domain-containing protein [Vibrio breoganii]|uniref:DUF3299 domain-containing protein n=1 Tax=Vibrio breoganii TaxID=553239 RepID=UPI00080EC282|nr:DUF3299 domain-containing protein [Vibrio breoganii]OCH76512.1 hypothetical protein A6D95_00075 [Vibrio breoganii]PMI15264.1 hypothetical protein BCU49_15995 [Vibrio breoganii]PML15050.1 hypothetical protein BCT84_09530 [Vibrio breoganii]PML28477.1 hypothetical protein BCT82_07015 [Vibrio breoganii]PMO63004.1 hypothetical protein BCT06_07670 [Vibrio breoganii]
MIKYLTAGLLCLFLSACSQEDALQSRAATLTNWEQLLAPEQRETFLNVMEQEKLKAKEHDELDPFIQPQSIGNDVAMVNPEIVNKQASVAGFVVPLEWDMDVVTEFLLVPYFGACIHIPPPPASQMIHVHYPEGVPNLLMRDAVVVSGMLVSQQDQFGDAWDVAYQITSASVEAY